jgi:hypothetical protein
MSPAVVSWAVAFQPALAKHKPTRASAIDFVIMEESPEHYPFWREGATSIAPTVAVKAVAVKA